MVRQADNAEFLSDFSQWIRDECADSNELTVTDLDYVIKNRNRMIMFVLEAKCYMKKMHYGQMRTFIQIDKMLRRSASLIGYTYWGFYIVQFPETLPAPGMLLNGNKITANQFIDHMNCYKRFCRPLTENDWYDDRFLARKGG